MRRLFSSSTTDRTALMALLAVPVIIAILAFALAVALTAFGVPKIGSMRSGVAGLAYVYLMLCLMWLPAYAAGCIWFWWATRDSESRLMVRLFSIPLVASLFAWFPALAFASAPVAQRVRMFPVLAVTALVAGFAWIGLVRLTFYLWRRK